MYSTLTLALAGLATIKSATAWPRTTPQPAPYLNQLAQKHGKLWFGTAADIPLLTDGAGTTETTDQAYLTIFNDTRVFGEVTPANAMKVEEQVPQPLKYC